MLHFSLQQKKHNNLITKSHGTDIGCIRGQQRGQNLDAHGWCERAKELMADDYYYQAAIGYWNSSYESSKFPSIFPFSYFFDISSVILGWSVISYAGEFSLLPSARQQLPSARHNPQMVGHRWFPCFVFRGRRNNDWTQKFRFFVKSVFFFPPIFVQQIHHKIELPALAQFILQMFQIIISPRRPCSAVRKSELPLDEEPTTVGRCKKPEWMIHNFFCIYIYDICVCASFILQLIISSVKILTFRLVEIKENKWLWQKMVYAHIAGVFKHACALHCFINLEWETVKM